ncbi:choice-of-anchor J domain-containing protein [Echinicola marina]|uniref:T9SS-dependent choice-of-anchor J family protein n=1 Tax=Echinicola marina TaxID=2859768 RepID=UPI001CF6EBDA|nr:choice-of-anchor J domain-containing protein [Echinicola marina]UCS92347.1 choice-of-anchor J domain-containing protein [Echinicola marina]
MKRIILILRIKLVLSFLFFELPPVLAQNIQANIYQTEKSFQKEPEKCAAGYLEAKQEEELGLFGSKDYFEAWMSDKIQSRKLQPQIRSAATEIRKIPVVVHIIHNGEPLGEGANIPLSQIQAQIDILNKDFRRLNEDASNTPAEFLEVAADTYIEFVLAKQDPKGLPTDGINRVQGTKSTYTQADANLISQLSYWDSNEYLNLWVVTLQSPYIGYSSFPISDLDGLNFAPSSNETDGTTIDYRYFGTGGNASSGSLGRTATHEIGHYLGLRHIWGDGGCDVDDYVMDTPDQSSSNTNCRSTPRETCNSRDMIENYMDYTPDRCMNIFTAGQLERMNVVLANSPRRVNLVNGRATQEPVIYPTDLALEQIIAPQNYICSATLNPQISVFNVGINPISSAELVIRLNGQVIEQKRFNLILDQGESAQLEFSSLSLPANENSFEVEILTVNGAADDNNANNNLGSSPQLQVELNLPYAYQSNDFDNLWTVKNEDGGITWTKETLNINGTPQEAIGINFYNYDAAGKRDYLISPQINLSNYPDAQLVFEVAYAPYPQEGLDDALIIGISTDCGNSFDLLNPPYAKTQDSLITAEESEDNYIPSQQTEFRTEIVNLKEYADLGNIRIAFIAVNGYGNNLFIKNISIRPTEEMNYSLALEEVISPSPITDGSQAVEVLRLTNTGTLPVNTFLLDRRVNGASLQTLIAEGNNIAPEESILLELPNALIDGLNEVEYRLHSPNFDQNNNSSSTILRYYVQDADSIQAPWRQYFDNTLELAPWLSLSPEIGENAWELAVKQTGETGDNLASLKIEGSNNSYWIASPLMDLSKAPQASIFFERAASAMQEGSSMKVLLSTDGGVHFDQELAVYTGEELNTIAGSAPVNPNSDEEFMREFIDLSVFTGNEMDHIRLAFVIENAAANSNPVYLDNIEFFLSNNPDPVNPGNGNALVYPNPATDIFNIAFNLEDFEDIRIQVMATSGQVVHDVTYPGTLNQTYSFSTSLFTKGVFIIKIQSESLAITKRLIIH